MLTKIPLAFAANRQPDILDAAVRSEKDACVFLEIREVLKKYGLERKYGISLLHKHFDLADDEILLEHTDLETRTLTTKPTKLGAVPPGSLIETLWMFDDDVVMGNCVVVCYAEQTGHVGRHRPAGA